MVRHLVSVPFRGYVVVIYGRRRERDTEDGFRPLSGVCSSNDRNKRKEGKELGFRPLSGLCSSNHAMNSVRRDEQTFPSPFGVM